MDLLVPVHILYLAEQNQKTKVDFGISKEGSQCLYLIFVLPLAWFEVVLVLEWRPSVKVDSELPELRLPVGDSLLPFPVFSSLVILMWLISANDKIIFSATLLHLADDKLNTCHFPEMEDRKKIKLREKFNNIALILRMWLCLFLKIILRAENLFDCFEQSMSPVYSMHQFGNPKRCQH